MPLNPQQFETCSALRPQLSPRRAQLRRGDPDARVSQNFALFFSPSSLLFILAIPAGVERILMNSEQRHFR